MSRSSPCPCRLFLFDLDGTLIDSRGDLAVSVNLVLERMRLRAVEMASVGRFVGDGARKLVERALRESTGKEPAPTDVERGVELFFEEYGRHLLDSTEFYPGVREALDKLHWAAFAIVTNKPEGFSRRIIEALGLAGRFTVILGGDSTERRKPDPEPLLKALHRCGVSAGDAVMVGDSPVDIQAGRAAGTLTCGITGGYRTRAELESAAPDFLVPRVADLPDYFTAPASR